MTHLDYSPVEHWQRPDHEWAVRRLRSGTPDPTGDKHRLVLVLAPGEHEALKAICAARGWHMTGAMKRALVLLARESIGDNK